MRTLLRQPIGDMADARQQMPRFELKRIDPDRGRAVRGKQLDPGCAISDHMDGGDAQPLGHAGAHDAIGAATLVKISPEVSADCGASVQQRDARIGRQDTPSHHPTTKTAGPPVITHVTSFSSSQSSTIGSLPFLSRY